MASFGATMNNISKDGWQDIAHEAPETFSEAGQQYADTKYANVLFAKGLHDRFGEWLRAIAVHPGFIVSMLYRDVIPEFLWPIIPTLSQIVAKSETNGANVIILAAHRNDFPGGSFISSNAEVWDYPNAMHVDTFCADTLWLWSQNALAPFKKEEPVVAAQAHPGRK